MKTMLVALLAVVLAAAMTPTILAGEEKCTMSTQECLDAMAKYYAGRGIIGVEGDWNEEKGIYLIQTFLDGTQAKAAGVRPGDALVAINGIKLNDKEGSKADSPNRVPGAKAKITLLRDGVEKTVEVALISMSREQIATAIGMHMLDHVSTDLAKAN